MKISEILANNESGVCFEFFPPRTPKSQQRLMETIQALKKYNPLYTSMTCGAGGTTQDKTEEAALLLKERDLTVMPHLTCLGSSQQSLEEILKNYQAKGIENIMALRGDPLKEDSGLNSQAEGFNHAVDLVRLIRQKTDFCIGVAVYPEGHIESGFIEEDLTHTQEKIDAGASFGVTQMFFDNAYYFQFLERIKKRGIRIPILPGILPLTDIAKVKEFAAICRTTIPKYIREKMEKLENNPQDMEKAGIDFTIQQCRSLKNNGFEKIHFFTLNKPKVLTAILDAIK